MIVYLHGFNSSPASGKARQLGEHMAGIGRQADYYLPGAAQQPARSHRCRGSGTGASPTRCRSPWSAVLLGGFYATHLAEKHGWKAVLVNPAVHAQPVVTRCARPADQLAYRRKVGAHRSAPGRTRGARHRRHYPA
ncbi:MAG: hypothetical protein MZV65_02150 [Chromatiales bacterium]|nr:hypothetical protein [Chromatiales bacterium]